MFELELAGANPLQWLSRWWLSIRDLPERLLEIAASAHEALSDSSRPMHERQIAGRVWAEAMADRAEVQKLLDDNVRVEGSAPTEQGAATWQEVRGYDADAAGVYSNLAGVGLGALPVIAIVGAVSALTVATTLVAIFGRASTYERELDIIGAGAATPEQVQALREGAPAPGGVTGVIAASTDLLKWALIGAAAYVAFQTWDRGR